MGGGHSKHRRRLRPALLVAALVVAAVVAAPSGAVAETGSVAGSAEVPESTERLVREFSSVMSLRIAPSSMCLTVLLDDDVIVDAQGDTALMPASVMKIVTAAAAMDMMGPDGVYTTEVFVRTDALDSVVDGIFHGDMYLVGGGDPVLNTPRYGDRIPDPVAYTDVTELAETASRESGRSHPACRRREARGLVITRPGQQGDPTDTGSDSGRRLPVPRPGQGLLPRVPARRRRARVAVHHRHRPNMDLLSRCNALRTTLINAAAQYTYGPVPSRIPFEVGVWTVPG